MSEDGAKDVVAIDGSIEEIEWVAVFPTQAGFADQYGQTLGKTALSLFGLFLIWSLSGNWIGN